MGDMIKPQGRVKNIFAYLKDSVRFHDMDNPFFVQVVFLLELIILFGGYWFARPYVQDFYVVFEQMSVRLQEQLTVKNFDLSFMTTELYTKMWDSMTSILLIFFVIKSVSFFVGLLYATYYHYSLTQPSMKGQERILTFLRRLPKLIAFNFLFYFVYLILALVLLMVTGIITLLMPVLSVMTLILPMFFIIAGILFMFKDLLIVEFDVGILKNFKKSLDITKDSRKNIVVNGLWPVCIGGIVSLLTIDVQNPMLSLFISSFFEVVILFVSQRLMVLMFIDAASLARQDKKEIHTESV